MKTQKRVESLERQVDWLRRRVEGLEASETDLRRQFRRIDDRVARLERALNLAARIVKS